MKRIITIIAVNILVAIVFFSVSEVVYRWYIRSSSVFEGEPYFEYDRDLGWSPKPGTYIQQGITTTITPDRFRQTDPPDVEAASCTILACGDSFTFCNFVSDWETWPYYLAEQLKCRVINAGVSGYGLDQSVLRMVYLIDRLKPDLVILSLIYDDIARCQLGRRIHYKPYFILEEGSLHLRNHPVPFPSEVRESSAWYEKSLIFRDIFRTFENNEGIAHRYDIIEHYRGMEVAERLCEFAAAFAAKKNIGFMILIQPNRPSPYRKEIEGTDALETAVVGSDIPVLNLSPIWRKEFADREAEAESMYGDDTGHMSAEGNRWVASRVAAYIKDNQELADRLHGNLDR
jgi:lysophospholipase L1-like esterase